MKKKKKLLKKNTYDFVIPTTNPTGNVFRRALSVAAAAATTTR